MTTTPPRFSATPSPQGPKRRRPGRCAACGVRCARRCFPPSRAFSPRGVRPLHGPLRDLLLGAEEPALRESVLAMALHMRGAAMEEDPQDGDETPVVNLRTERTAFQFEREHIQELVMFFSDIQGYSKKAQLLTPLQLSALIQEYEAVLLAHVDDHRGELVKRMGDGHMIVFGVRWTPCSPPSACRNPWSGSIAIERRTAGW